MEITMIKTGDMANPSKIVYYVDGVKRDVTDEEKWLMQEAINRGCYEYECGNCRYEITAWI